jgi:hypothetical protein
MQINWKDVTIAQLGLLRDGLTVAVDGDNQVVVIEAWDGLNGTTAQI